MSDEVPDDLSLLTDFKFADGFAVSVGELICLHGEMERVYSMHITDDKGVDYTFTYTRDQWHKVIEWMDSIKDL